MKKIQKDKDIIKWLNWIIIVILLYIAEFNWDMQGINRDYTKVQEQEYCLLKPTSLAIDKNNLIYVFDAESSVLQVYNSNGDFQWSLAVPGTTQGRSGKVVIEENVLYIMNNKYSIYKYENKKIVSLEKDNKQLETKLYDEAKEEVYDSKGNKYTIGSFNNIIKKTTPSPESIENVIVEMNIFKYILYLPMPQIFIKFILVVLGYTFIKKLISYLYLKMKLKEVKK